MWWAATALNVWPDEGDNTSNDVAKVLDEFDLSTRWGDRRQELVFIGIGMYIFLVCEDLIGYTWMIYVHMCV